MNIPAWEEGKARIKMTYDGLEWNQHTNESMDWNLDIFTNLDKVKAICGGGNNLQEMICWSDAYNYSLMNKTQLTEDIYQFISHRAYIMRDGFVKEIAKWKANGGLHWEVLQPLWDSLLQSGATALNFICEHGLETLGFILECVGL